MDSQKENRIRYLLNRCLSGQVTSQERVELDAFFTDEQSQENLSKELITSFYQSKDLVDMLPEKQDQILNAIHFLDLEADVQPIRKVTYWRWVGVAAALIGVLFVFFLNKTEDQPATIYVKETRGNEANKIEHRLKNSIIKDRNPARDVAILNMAGGSRIELDKLEAGKALEQEGLVMERLDGTLRLRFISDAQKNKNFVNQINTIETPSGGTYKVVLSDGTVVHLNSGSKLSFPSVFSAKERRVTFSGEGYFDVAKDKSRQFVVVSGGGRKKQEIRVYGTEFNISAYPDDDEIKTTLVEGSVKIKDLATGSEMALRPNELAVLGKEGLTVENADLAASLAWKNNQFYFADEPIDQVLKQIGRWYDIHISYGGTLSQEHVWGQISRMKKLSEVLAILEKTNQLKFEINGKEVNVAPK